MDYREWSPDPALRPRIANYWRFAVTAGPGWHTDHVIVPDGLVSLTAIFTGGALATVLIVGPATRALTVPVASGDISIGIRLQPGHARAILGIDPAALADSLQPTDRYRQWAIAMLGDPASIDQLRLNAAASALLDGRPPGDALVTNAAARWMAGHEAPPVATVAAALGLGERQLRRRFTAEAGLSPKAFARVRRQRAAWVAAVGMAGTSLTDTAAGSGYADQAHFTRDIKALFGAPPTSIRPQLTRITHHFAQS